MSDFQIQHAGNTQQTMPSSKFSPFQPKPRFEVQIEPQLYRLAPTIPVSRDFISHNKNMLGQMDTSIQKPFDNPGKLSRFLSIPILLGSCVRPRLRTLVQTLHPVPFLTTMINSRMITMTWMLNSILPLIKVSKLLILRHGWYDNQPCFGTTRLDFGIHIGLQRSDLIGILWGYKEMVLIDKSPNAILKLNFKSQSTISSLETDQGSSL